MVVNPGTPEERRLGNIDTAILQPGACSTSARPVAADGATEREPGRVAEDVARGYVSEAAALRDYGVVLKGGMVDEAETRAARAAMPVPEGHFHFGPEREGYEVQWPPAAYDRLTAILAALPIHWRFFTKTEIFRRMKGGNPRGAEGVDAAF